MGRGDSRRIRTADVALVGAGILGASAAYELARAGHDVVVFERKAANREGSGTTAGNLHIQAIHARRPGQAVPVDVGRLLPLQKAASELWASVEDDLGESVELRRSGGLTVAETAPQLDELVKKGELERDAGIDTELLSGDEARSAMPELSRSVLGATWCALDGYANPLLVTPAYLRGAVRAGADVVPFSPVTAIAHEKGSYRVETDSATWSVGAVIDVAGPWIADVAALAGLRLAMTPVAIQMLITRRVPQRLAHLVQHVGEGLSVKQVGSGQVLVGGGWPARALDLDGRSAVSVSNALENARLAARILPFLEGATMLRAWAGPLAATPDEMPVVGAVGGSPAFFVAGGTYAFTFAPLWARCLRALLEGAQAPVSLAGLGPDRLAGTSQGAHTDREGVHAS